MGMKQVFHVLGAKGFKDTIEGRAFDQCKIRVQMPVSERNGNEAGFDVSEWLYGPAANFDLVRKLPYPCDLELEVEMTTKGMEVVSVGKVISAAKVA